MMTKVLPFHSNNFGVLRLLLASMVIIGHSPELIDGSRAREPLFQLTGTQTLGITAVAGFFLLSGYLIAQSMIRSADVGQYLLKRLLRIVPGFVIAYVLSVLVLAPLMGVDIRPHLGRIFLNLVLLREPPPIFGDVEPFYHTINGALWTISYEFRCYLLIALLWILRILQKRAAVLALTALFLAAMLSTTFPSVSSFIEATLNTRVFRLFLGLPVESVSFVAMFLTGTCVYLYRGEFMSMMKGWHALAAMLILAAYISNPHVSKVAVTLMGGAVLFWLAIKADIGPLQKINDRWDISYGTYLYGWPCAVVVLAISPTISPVYLALLALCMALTCGVISWWLVERHFRYPPSSTLLFWRRRQMIRPTDRCRE